MDKKMENKTSEREMEERRNETTNDQQVFHLVLTLDHTSREKICQKNVFTKMSLNELNF